MRSFRWGLVLALIGLAISLDLLSATDRVLLIVVAALVAWSADIAHATEDARTGMTRRWKERQERQHRTHVTASISKIDADMQKVLAKLDRDMQTQIAHADTDEEKAARLADWEKVHAVLHEIIGLYDNAMTYGTLAADTIKDIDDILAGSAAETNAVETVIGLPLTVDRDYQKKTSSQSKVEQISLRTRLYHKERTDKIGKDMLLFPSSDATT